MSRSTHYFGCFKKRVEKLGISQTYSPAPSVMVGKDFFDKEDDVTKISSFINKVFQTTQNEKYTVMTVAKYDNLYSQNSRIGTRPLTQDYMNVVIGACLHNAFLTHVPGKGAPLYAVLSNSMSFIDATKGGNAPTDFTPADYFEGGIDNITRVFNELATYFSVGARRFNDDTLAKLRNILANNPIRIKDSKDWPCNFVPLETALLADITSFVFNIRDVIKQSFVTSTEVKQELVAVPAVSQFDEEGGEFLMNLLKTSVLLKESAASIKVTLSQFLEIDSVWNVVMPILKPTFLSTEYGLRMQRFFELSHMLESMSLLISHRWKYLKEYVAYKVLSAVRSGAPFDEETSTLLPFFNDIADLSSRKDSINGIKMPATTVELDEQLKIRRYKVEPLLPLVMEIINTFYYKDDKPYSGFRIYHGFIDKNGRDVIYRIEKTKKPSITTLMFDGVAFCCDTGNSYQTLGSRIESTPNCFEEYVAIPENEQKQKDPFIQQAFTTDLSQAEIASLKNDMQYYTTYVETTYDEEQCSMDIWKESHAMLIRPCNEGEDHIAFWNGRRIDTNGEFYRITNVDVQSTDLPLYDILTMFRYDSASSEMDSDHLRELFESRIKAIKEEAERVADVLLVAPIRVEIESPLARCIALFGDEEPPYDELLLVGPSTTGLRSKSLPQTVSFNKAEKEGPVFCVPFDSLSPQMQRLLEKSSTNSYEIGRDENGQYSLKLEVLDNDSLLSTNNRVRLVKVSTKFNYKQTASFGTRALRKTYTNGATYMVSIRYPIGIDNVLATGHNWNFQTVDGLYTVDYPYFNRAQEFGLLTEFSKSMPVVTAIKFLQQLCCAYIFSRSKFGSFRHFDHQVAIDELKAFTEARLPDGYLNATFGVSEALGTVKDIQTRISVIIKSWESDISKLTKYSKSDEEKLTKYDKLWLDLAALIVPSYVARLNLLHITFPPRVDSYCKGLMSAILSGRLRTLSMPLYVEGVTGPMAMAIDDSFNSEVATYVKNLLTAFLNSNLCAEILPKTVIKKHALNEQPGLTTVISDYQKFQNAVAAATAQLLAAPSESATVIAKLKSEYENLIDKETLDEEVKTLEEISKQDAIKTAFVLDSNEEDYAEKQKFLNFLKRSFKDSPVLTDKDAFQKAFESFKSQKKN